MDKEQVAKDIIFVGQYWNRKREKAEEKLNALLERFSCCEHCKDPKNDQVFLLVEELKSGLFVKKFSYEVFLVCSLKCLLDRGLKSKGYYSLVVRLANGEVHSTGFMGQNAVAINEFIGKINNSM